MSLRLPVSKPHCIPMRLSGLARIIDDSSGMRRSSAMAPASVPWVGLVCCTPVDMMAVKSSTRASRLGSMPLAVRGSMPYTKMSSLCTQADLEPPLFRFTSISRFTFSGG